MRKTLFCLLLLALFATKAQAEQKNYAFDIWLSSFAGEAEAAGVSPATLGRVLPGISFDPGVIDLDRRQPESRLSFDSYARGILAPARIAKGKQLMGDYAQTLRAAETRFGIEPAMIVALWAIESNYGSNQGAHGVLDSLASLAFEGRRSSFFRKELIHALKIIDEERLDPDEMEGSWAGAMGQCQFMPSTFRAYAVDFDGDGNRNIWTNDIDAIGSIANYLKAEGWQAGWRWGREVKLSRPVAQNLVGLEVRKNLAFWRGKGVRTKNGKMLPNQRVDASLIQPDGPGGRSFLVYDNFRALMRWNRSTYFATSVGLLADQINGER